ncbi:MAG TPA: GNAT family N-acetyltransferase [Chloroflexia bacterium]|nr:GNAT family N-acetyltransferase [Chloroflexia bacterium]
MLSKVELQMRPYYQQQDLSVVGGLMRRTYDQAPFYNAWSIFRYDSWAQRRLCDERIFGQTGWQNDIFLWADAQENPCGALFYENENAVVVAGPGDLPLFEQIIAQAERHSTQKGLNRMSVEILGSNHPVQTLLELRGYSRPDDHMIYRERRLETSSFEPVRLPPGFHLKTLETDEELAQFQEAVKAVFNYEDCPQAYRLVQEAPTYVPELDLIILTEQGEVASFCTAWFDKERGLAEFEPVGTKPAFRRRGLSRELLAEAHNRLRQLGCRISTVCSYSGALPANNLYCVAGLEPRDRIYTWHKPLG